MGIADEIPTVPIAILGPSGVGKTTYLATLYTQLQTPANRLTASALDQVVHDRLTQIGADVHQGAYPRGTLGRARFDLSLKVDAAPVLRFYWHDYAGVALDSFDDNEQTRGLLRDLDEMEALVIACDSSDLDNKTRAKRFLSALAVANTRLAGVEKPLTIVVLLTKADTIPEWTPDRLRPLTGFLQALAANGKHDVILAPVSCSPSSSHVTAPLFHILWSSSRRRAAEYRRREASEQDSAVYWSQKSNGFRGFLRELRDTWTNTTTDLAMAAAARKRAADLGRLGSELETLAALSQKLGAGVVPVRSGASADDYAHQLNGSKASRRAASRQKTMTAWR